MKICLLCTLAVAGSAFLVGPVVRPHRTTTTVWQETKQEVDSEVESKVDEIAHKLRLHGFDVDTGVYGFESKDHAMGIENIHTSIAVDHKYVA